VQRRFTKRLKGLSELSYDDRLKLLNLERLEIRRLRFDLLCCYKIIFGLMRIYREAFFELRTSCTRGHPYKLCKFKHHSGQTSLLSKFLTCQKCQNKRNLFVKHLCTFSISSLQYHFLGNETICICILLYGLPADHIDFSSFPKFQRSIQPCVLTAS